MITGAIVTLIRSLKQSVTCVSLCS